jgi:hypothetical protein
VDLHHLSSSRAWVLASLLPGATAPLPRCARRLPHLAPPQTISCKRPAGSCFTPARFTATAATASSTMPSCTRGPPSFWSRPQMSTFLPLPSIRNGVPIASTLGVALRAACYACSLPCTRSADSVSGRCGSFSGQGLAHPTAPARSRTCLFRHQDTAQGSRLWLWAQSVHRGQRSVRYLHLHPSLFQIHRQWRARVTGGGVCVCGLLGFGWTRT